MEKLTSIDTLRNPKSVSEIMSFFFDGKARFFVLLAVGFAGTSPSISAQTSGETPKPYATLDRQAVAYRGPATSAEKERSDRGTVIGLVVPMKGAQKSEGMALLAAAQLAIEEERLAGPLAGGRKLELVARDESGQWGQASVEILKLFEEDHAVAILTSANGTSAHLAEQIANKVSIPILTLASDPTTTETNVPWLFRLGASDTDQARAFCARIYDELKLQKVLLVVQGDHDGRIGGGEFEKAAKARNVPAPLRLELTGTNDAAESFRIAQQKTEPEAVVIWTDEPTADALVPVLEAMRPSTPVLLCRKAAQLRTSGMGSAESFTIGSRFPDATDSSRFQRAFAARTGTNPGLAAEEMYQAVRMLASALRATGANRVLLRDYLANQAPHEGKVMPFDPAGNSMQEFTIVSLQKITP
jgi:ABC-type branched-subunit amino acid transport system substrate-binding protein